MPFVVMTDIAGLILAGGKSRRMGRDKAELMRNGVSFLDHAKTLLGEAGCQQILISHPEHLADRYPGAGPLAGLEAATAKVEAGSLLLVIPIDMPNQNADVLRTLIAQNPAVGAYFERQPLPFIARVTSELRQRLRETLGRADADRSLFHLFRGMGFDALAIPQDSERQFENCNTPEQFKQMETGW
jgi:molybdopterin-guanine dinucleotide biosynthesis protein A